MSTSPSSHDAAVFEQVFIPAFVKAAAVHGIVINTQEELENALNICQYIQTAKQAQAQSTTEQLSKVAAVIKKLAA